MPGTTLKLQKVTTARQRELKAITFKTKYEKTKAAYREEQDPAKREQLWQEVLDAKLNWEYWQRRSDLDKLRRSEAR